MPKGKYFRTKETRRKNSEASKKYRHTEEAKRKISEALKGSKSPCYGIPLSDATKKKLSDSHKGHVVPESVRKKTSESTKGSKNHFYRKHHTNETKEKISKKLTGKKVIYSEETKKKIHEIRIKTVGEKNGNWKGGVTSLHKRIRYNEKYFAWRNSVFQRDNYLCQHCFEKKNWVEAHHCIKRFSEIIKNNNIKSVEQAIKCDDLWDTSNGITLCKKCHTREHKKAPKS